MEDQDKLKKTKEAHYLFLTLWDKAVGKEEYDKQEWNRLRLLLNELGVEL